MNKKVCSTIIDALNYRPGDKTKLAQHANDHYKTGEKKWWEKSAHSRSATVLQNFTNGILICKEFDKRIVITEMDINIDDYAKGEHDKHTLKYQVVTLHKDFFTDSSSNPLLNKKYYYSKQLQNFDFTVSNDGSVTEENSNWINSNKVHYANLNYIKPKNYGMCFIYKIEANNYLKDIGYVVKYIQPYIMGDVRFIYTDFLL